MSLTILTTAFWLSLTAASSSSSPSCSSSLASSSSLPRKNDPSFPPQTSRLLLNTGLSTKVKPLTLLYNPEELDFDKKSLKAIKNWLKKIASHNSAIHLYSYSSLSKTQKDTAQKAARLAFNRAIIIQNFIERQGIDKNRMAVHLIGRCSPLQSDQIEITL